MKRRLSLLLLWLLAACAPMASKQVSAPDSRGPWQDWQEFVLPGKRGTVYEARHDSGRIVMHAQATASASMLRRRLQVDPTQLGSVQFSWHVASLIDQADLSDADAADSPVRLVFAFDGDHGRLSARNRMLFELAQVLTGEPPPYATLMYVWDNRAAPESVIHGPRTDRIRKIVLESGPGQCGRWLHYERDLAADFRRAFGEEPGRLIGVGLMTDADNTASSAAGLYGEVRLLGRNGVPL